MNIDRWREYLKEETLLREISEDELEHIQAALSDVGPSGLAFPELFGDKTRIIIDFATLDETSKLGGFVNLFDVWKYSVNWKAGIVSAEKEFKDSSPDAMADAIMNRGGLKKHRAKKVQMKIGKFFGKKVG